MTSNDYKTHFIHQCQKVKNWHIFMWLAACVRSTGESEAMCAFWLQIEIVILQCEQKIIKKLLETF